MVEIKGIAIIDTINAVKERSGEQNYLKILDLLKPDTRKLFEDTTILNYEWYSLDLFLDFLDSDIKITANGDYKVLIERSEKIIEKHLKGIYSILVKLGSPESVISRISTTHKTYFKGVSIECKIINSEKANIKYFGFKKQNRLIGFSIIGFYKKALEISGAKNIKVVFITPIEEGKDFCELEITWKK